MSRRKGTVTVPITVPSTFEVPEFFTSATPDAQAEALRIGAILYGTLKDLKAEENNATIAELEVKKQAEIARIREQAATNLLELQTELATAQEQYTVLQKQHTERMASALTQERSTLKSMYEAQVQRCEETIASLKHKAQLTAVERDTDIQKAEDRAKATHTAVLEEKQRTIDRQQRENEKLTAALEKHSEELKQLSLNLQAKRLQNSKAKGEEFEAVFREKLIQAYGTGPNFSIEETSKNGLGHQADHIMNWDNKKILWEVKNYDGSVKTAEVEKFYRDMNENSTISIGVMVSRYSAITGKNSSGNKHIEFVNDKMLLYLNNFDSMGEDTLPGLMLLFKMYWHASRTFETRETIENAVRTIEKLHTDAVKAKTDWKQHKAHMEALLRFMAEVVEKNEECLQNALRGLRAGGSEKITIPTTVFRDVSGEEKAMECIRHILEVATVNPDENCVLNDLATAVSERMNLTRDTVRDHIRGLLLDTALIPNKGKNPARVQGLQLKSSSSFVR